jgi:hypothetical protein
MTLGKFLREVHALEGEIRSNRHYPTATEAQREDCPAVMLRLQGSADVPPASVILYAGVSSAVSNQDADDEALDHEWEVAATQLLRRVKEALKL